MSFSVGIVGLPNVGKSTLFKALTKKQVDIAPYPFTTISPNVGVVAVPDERLLSVAKIIKPEKVTPTIIEFIDIAGLVKGAHKGQGLGNQFLAHIRECDTILEVVRGFLGENIEHVEKSIDPERDVEIIKMELIMKDLETAEKVLQKLESDAKSGDKEVIKKLGILKRVQENLAKGEKIFDLNLTPEENLLIKEFQFLTAKPTIYILNTKEENVTPLAGATLSINLKLEEEISELSEIEAKELGTESQLDQIILACYNILDLITFYTVAGGKEVRAWTLPRGTKAPQAGGRVHSDFEEKFIRAEMINWQKLVEADSWSAAKEKGWIKTQGKDYIVQDGDVIEFKI